ncbi:MAG: hypothetical protein ABSH39_04145 [Candidatus Acidiferrum sp.]
MKLGDNNPVTDPGPRTKERRREPRFEVSIEVEVSAFDHFGKPFREVTRTIEVSEWGCSFRLAAQLDVDALAALDLTGDQPYCLHDTQPVMFQVNYSKLDSGTWMIGASKMQAERLWDIETMGSLPKT